MLDLVDKEVLSQPIFRGDPFPIETKWTTALLLRSERAFSHKTSLLEQLPPELWWQPLVDL